MSKTLESRIGGPFERALDKVVVTVGKDVFTRRQCRDAKMTSLVGFRRLMKKAVKKHRPISIRDLAQQMSLDDFFDLGGAEMSLGSFCEALDMKGVLPLKWLNGSLGRNEKVSTACARRRRIKLKRQKRFRLLKGNTRSAAS